MPAPRTQAELRRRTAQPPAAAAPSGITYNQGRISLPLGWSLALLAVVFAAGIAAEATGGITGRVRSKAADLAGATRERAAGVKRKARRKIAEKRAALALKIAGEGAFAAGADDDDEDPRPSRKPARKGRQTFSAVALDRA
jgi:hypothetical protein